MLNTPTGLRWPEDGENTMLVCGGFRLGRYITEQIRSEEKKVDHEGVIFKAVREDSPFHALNARAKLVLLHSTFSTFLDPYAQNPMTQFWNATLECVYSCLLYEVKKEIEQTQHGINAARINATRSNVRHNIYYAWEAWFHGTEPVLNANSTVLDDWIRALDKLAARTVYDLNFAKQFEPGYLPDITDQLVTSAQIYLEGLQGWANKLLE